MSDNDNGTRSLSPAYKETVEKHDRVYQKFSVDNRVYCVPVDEKEEERLAIQEEIVNILFDDSLFLSPTEDPKRVLDCGYGQCQWAVAVAEQYPDCKVTGVDIYPIDLADVPDNLRLECDDLNQNLTEVYPVSTFDVIQSRFVGPGIHKNRWPSYVREIARLLKPGGHVQMMEYYVNFQSNSGAIERTNALYIWGEKYRQAMEADRDPRIGSRTSLHDHMRQAGLVDIEYQNISLPIGDWPTDPKEKQTGLKNLRNVELLLESFGTWPFIERLNMTKEESDDLCARARQEAGDPRIKAYIPLTVAWGTKPGVSSSAQS